jgi:sulfite reductase (NADPH) flavoprotein alpha-component
MAEPLRLPHVVFPDDRAALLGSLTEGLDAPALYWLSGYAAGLAIAANRADAPRPAATAPLAAPAASERLTIVYGSQTGNSKRLAEQLGRSAEAAGLAVRVVRADAYPQRELKSETLLYVVISTQGDGDPPDDARGFVEFLASKRAPQLPQLRYSVLGLGDSSYPQFCAIGRRLDERLAALGETRLIDRADAALDLETVADPWAERALAAAKEALKSQPPLATVTPLRPDASAPAYNRDKPFGAPLLANQRLTARGSAKDVRHLELALEGSGLAYEPGDSLGVWHRNPASLVSDVLAATKLDGEILVAQKPLREWLTSERELTRLTRGFVAAHAGRARSDEVAAADRALLDTHQPLDILRKWPAAWDAAELVAALRPLTPRLYSIASSRKAVGDEAHLTVARVAYDAFGHPHLGAASAHLAESGDDAKIDVYVEANERFRVPKDPTRDAIMIGPGTGVAPFRGFVQERAATGATGRNWLFFGNPHFETDFLYQLQWQQALRDGTLAKIDLAFSRDDAHKIYVQHRLAQRGAEVYDWLERGAHLYVCGEATKMAKAVHAQLVMLVARHGGKSGEAAAEYVENLQQQGRYARDVY